MLARGADLALEGCGVVCAAWLNIGEGRGTPGKVGTYRSPAASEGKEPNEPGCLGRGDSLKMDHISMLMDSMLRMIPEIRVFKRFLCTYSLIWVVGEEGREYIMPRCGKIGNFCRTVAREYWGISIVFDNGRSRYPGQVSVVGVPSSLKV